ncbi:hypothetical protein [Natronomonas pharaonis]|uniref:hypothetical protein n=1 Tax=Natronomonas pharaonis TaxID=2257 RepID=UPI000677865D|nr:hypothetical protein [Natronomonas pharaonis]
MPSALGAVKLLIALLFVLIGTVSLAFAGGVVGTGIGPVDDAGDAVVAAAGSAGEAVDEALSAPPAADIEPAVADEVRETRAEHGQSDIRSSDLLQTAAQEH